MLLAKMYINHNAWFNVEDENYYRLCIDELNKDHRHGQIFSRPEL